MKFDTAGITDDVSTAMNRERLEPDTVGIRGTVFWQLTGADGTIKAQGSTRNLITQVGDQYYGERAAGIGSPPAQVTGMKLGTGSTAVAKTGAGAALVTYLSDSHQAIDGSFPTSALSGASRRITWKSTFAAGKATTASAIAEVALVNETLTDATSLAAATVARALLTGIGSKGAGDSLAITWVQDILGA